MDQIENKIVSIIVPVYNVCQFVDHCIQSIVDQTYSAFELILVDDGSTDSSGEICDTWAQKDGRISVIHQANGGLSAARNAGLDAAKGDYIAFIDSDDFVTENYIESLVDAIFVSDADMAFCDINSSKMAESKNTFDKNTILTARECRQWLTNPISREYVIMVVSWCKLYKREIFDSIRFKDGIYHEDEFLINDILFSIDKAIFVPEKNYIYRNNEDSITGKENAGNLYHLHAIDAYVHRIQMALDHDEKDFAALTFKWALLKMTHFYKEGDDAMKEKVRQMYMPIYKKYEHLLTSKQRLKYILFEKAPNIFCKLFI